LFGLCVVFVFEAVFFGFAFPSRWRSGIDSDSGGGRWILNGWSGIGHECKKKLNEKFKNLKNPASCHFSTRWGEFGLCNDDRRVIQVKPNAIKI
jgi:hypothetical protein